MKFTKSFFWALFLLIPLGVWAQTGSPCEPVRYIGGRYIDPNHHEGGLRYAIGVESRQILRANRTHPELSDGFGWTYNHAPMLAYCNHTFYVQYLSSPKGEHTSDGQTLLLTSKDGVHWEKPRQLFPPYKAPEGVQLPKGSTGYMMHQRMGFYVAPDGRLLALAFYAHSPSPFGKGGIGRVVREIHQYGTFGPIYFIRYSSFNNWNKTNTNYPFYKESPDAGFVAACDSLLHDRLKTLQWWDEDNGIDGFFSYNKSHEALSYYHRKDGKVVALWKHSFCALSSDNGYSFSEPVKAETLVMSGGKIWGQRTDDGKYALCYNPIDLSEYRWPLVIITGDDGIVFDHMLVVQGEVPPRRFYGHWKDFGPQYMRGIAEGNGNPPGPDMWLTYSMNKEDMWISRIPVPVRYKVNSDVNDTFENMKPDGPVTDWNIYSPMWAPVKLIEEKTGNKCIQMTDKDPYDYGRAIRVFKEGHHIKASMLIKIEKQDTAAFDIDITDRFGNCPVQLQFTPDGMLKASDGSSMKTVKKYETGKWYTLEIDMDATPYGHYSLSVNHKKVLDNAALVMAVKSAERISFRTGHYRNTPTRQTPNQQESPPLPGADEMQSPGIYLIDNVAISSHQKTEYPRRRLCR